MCSTIANFTTMAHGGKKRFSPKDFLLVFKNTKEGVKEQAAQPADDWKRLKMIAMMFAAASKADEAKLKHRKGRSK